MIEVAVKIAVEWSRAVPIWSPKVLGGQLMEQKLGDIAHRWKPTIIQTSKVLRNPWCCHDVCHVGEYGIKVFILNHNTP